MNDEIQSIISGKKQVSHGFAIQTALNYLRRSQETSALAQTDEYFKREETERLIHFVDAQNLWVRDININLYISEGAEQKVYMKDDKNVWKLNDAIYYLSWQDYLINLLLNNYFFPDTAYELRGFYKDTKNLYAVVIQPFVKANRSTDLAEVKRFMEANGFINTRNHDYYNPDWGIILEDLHDENVLTQDGILYFIDTVFYIKFQK